MRAKASNEVTGLIRGLLADGTVNELEARYLRDWLNSTAAKVDPIVRSLAARISRVFADGIVTPEELEEIKALLISFAGKEDEPTKLPLNEPAPDIVYPERSFCFTGTFVSGSRCWCWEQVEIRNGLPTDRVASGLHYLVIGAKVSDAWVNQTYGRKIEAAVKMREKGLPIAIVNEEHWLTSIQS